MIAVVLMIMFYLIHILLSTFALRSAACLCRFIGELTFYPASCENESKLGRAGKIADRRMRNSWEI